MKRFLMALPILMALGIGVFFYIGLGKDPKIVPSALIDKPAPEFELPALRGDGLGLAKSDLLGKVTIVNVFASWCIPCRAEHPYFMEAAKSGEFEIYGLNYKDKPEAALAWLRDLGDPYNRIGADQSGRVGIDWGVYGVPETFILDTEGRIRYKHVGPVTKGLMEETLLPFARSLKQ